MKTSRLVLAPQLLHGKDRTATFRTAVLPSKLIKLLFIPCLIPGAAFRGFKVGIHIFKHADQAVDKSSN